MCSSGSRKRGGYDCGLGSSTLACLGIDGEELSEVGRFPRLEAVQDLSPAIQYDKLFKIPYL